MRIAAGSLCLVSVLLTCPAAFAQTPPPRSAELCPAKPKPKAAARKLAGKWYVKGVKQFKAGQFREALTSFQCTHKIMPAKLTSYWIARSAEGAGDLNRALELYKDLLVDPPRLVKASELRWRISRIKDQLQTARPPGPRPPPKKPKKEPRPGRRTIPLKERPLGIAAWTTWATAAALIGAGIALSVVTWQNKKALSGASDGTPWVPDLRKKYIRHDGLVASTWTCLSLGIAAAAAGAVLFVFDHRRKERPMKVGIAPTPGGAYVGYTLRY